jgi:hypothetical protein
MDQTRCGELATWANDGKLYPEAMVRTIAHSAIHVRWRMHPRSETGDSAQRKPAKLFYADYEMGTVTVLAVLTHKDYDKGGWKSACNR